MISEMPLLIFTVLGGLAAGIYAVACFAPKAVEGKKPWVIPAITLVLLAIGGVALMFHLGHPERFLLALRNISAGITQEAYATMAFGVVVLIDLVLSLAGKQASRALRIVGTVLGIVLVLVMANAYFGITSVAAMHNVMTFVVFLACAAAMGATCILAMSTAEDNAKLARIAGILVGVAAASMLIEGIVYAGAGLAIAPHVIAAVLAAAGCACVFLFPKKGRVLAIAAFVLVFVAVVISRYAFYLAIA